MQNRDPSEPIGREPTAADLETARMLLTAHWTSFQYQTAEARDAYGDVLAAAVEDPETAMAVLDQLAKIALTAVMAGAGARDIEYDDALAELFREIETFKETMPGDDT